MLTGRVIDSAEADHIGLVTRVVDDDALLDTALETAAQIAANSPWGVRMTKEVAWSQLEVGSLQAGIDLENRTQILSSFTDDMREAMTRLPREARPDLHKPLKPPTSVDAYARYASASVHRRWMGQVSVTVTLVHLVADGDRWVTSMPRVT